MHSSSECVSPFLFPPVTLTRGKMINSATQNASTNPKNMYHIGGVPVEFPYQPYGSQLAFMGRLISTLDRAQREGHCHALLESPTGTGKSLSLLCSALAWQKHHGTRTSSSAPSQQSSKPDPRASNDPLNYGGGFLPESQQPSTPAAESLPSTNGKNQKKKSVPTIFYASRTHSQISQVIREYRKTAYRVPMAVLASRKHYCTNKFVRGRENLDEECKLLLENPENGCSEFKNVHKVKCHPSLQKGGCHEAHDIEDLVKVGQVVKGCSYFAATSMASDAHLVFCPYNYIVNPVIRRARDVDIKGAVIILDEAHNIEDMAREAGSVEVNEDALLKLQRELSELCHAEAMIYQPLYEMVQDILSWMERRKSTLEKRDFQQHGSSWTGEKALKELQEANLSQQCFPILQDCATKAIKAATDAESSGAHLSGMSSITLEGMFSSLSYFFKGDGIHMNDYQLSLRRLLKRDAGSPSGYLVHVFSLSCLHPAVVFKDIADASLSVILTSGTLSPMDSFSSELGVQFGTSLEAPHIIDVESQVWAAAISAGPRNIPLNASYKTADAYAFQDALGKALEEIFELVPGGSLVFFPSYKLMDKLCNRWHETGQWKRLNAKKPLFVEPKGGSQDDFDRVLKGYYSAVCTGSKKFMGRVKGKKMDLQCSKAERPQACKQKGAGFLAVCRGKVSEGIDFSDDYARAVIIVGIPFPNINDIQVVEKKKYNDTYKQSKHLESGSTWYCQQAFRALNQAAGRCIRHRLDHGAIIFLDERFHEKRNIMYISKWLRKSIRPYDNFEASMEELRSFFSNVKDKVDALNPHPLSAMPQEHVSRADSAMVPMKKKISRSTKSEIGERRVLPDTFMAHTRNSHGLKSNNGQNCHTSPLTSRSCEEVGSSATANLEDCGTYQETFDLECSVPESLRCSEPRKGFYSKGPAGGFVMETPDMAGNFAASNLSSPSVDENSSSTMIDSSISIKTSTQCLSELARSPEKTPKSAVTRNSWMISRKGSSPSLSVSSHIQKRRKALNSQLINTVPDEKPNVTSTECTHENGLVKNESACQRSLCLDVSFPIKKLDIQSSAGNDGRSKYMDKRMRLFCSLCRNPLGLSKNQFYVACSLTSLSKQMLPCLSKGQIMPGTLSVQPPVSAVLVDILTIDERLCNINIEDELRQGVCCEEDGRSYRTVMCPFCSLSSNCLGVQIVEADSSGSENNKIFLFHDRLELEDHETSPMKDTVKVDASQHADAAGINFDKYAFRSQRQSSGGWRTTRSKLRLPRGALLHNTED